MLHAADAGLPGLMSGVVWNSGNALSMLAVSDPGVGLAVAYPIMQSGLFVAGCWGVLLFGEQRGAPLSARLLYWGSGALVFSGACILASAK